MKQLYCCPRSVRGILSITKYTMTLVMMLTFVLSGTAANSYYEDNSSTVENAGSSIDNLLNLTAKLEAAQAFYSIPGGNEAKSGGGGGDCPCPDGIGPVLSIDSETFSLQCPDEVPEPPVVTAVDECDGPVDVSFFQFSAENGDVVCSASNAVGENPTFWAIWLPTLPSGYTDQWVFVEDGTFNEYADDTAVLTGTVAAIDNPNLRFKIHIKLVGNYDWTTWNSMLTVGNPQTNRIYKDALGFASENNNFETFSYYEIDASASYLVGEGDLLGAYLNIQHAPANFLFGAQVGLGANDTNGNYGMSSWFTYTGFFPDADGNLVATSGQGDVNIDLDCGSPVYQCALDVDYTYIAIDQCGNATTATLLYEVEDTTAPELIGCPENMTVECDAIPAPATVTAVDNCIGDVEVSFLEEIIEGQDCPQAYTISRVWAAEDSCGNRNECTQMITVVDTTSPVLEEAPADVTIECGEEIPPMAELTATDNCDDEVEVLPASSITQDVQCPLVEVITRSWTAYDDCGNTSTVSQTIYIQDTTAPDIMCPDDVTIECEYLFGDNGKSGDDYGVAIASDNCSEVTLSHSDSEITGDCPYYFTRTWTAVDECGNSSSCEQLITIEDTAPPVLSGGSSGSMIVECDDLGGAVEYANLDFESGLDNWTASAGASAEGSVAGQAANQGLLSASLTTSGDVMAIADVEAALGLSAGAFDVLSSVGQDFTEGSFIKREICVNAGDEIEFDYNFLSGEIPAASVIVDAAFVLMIEDGVIMLAEALETDLVASTGDADLTDMTGWNTFNHTFAGSGTCYLAFIVLDADDTIVESALMVDDINLTLAGGGVCGGGFEVTPPTAYDLCQGDIEVVAEVNENTENSCAGSIEYTWTATDNCGNSAVQTYTILIVDSEAPVFIDCPEDEQYACADEVPEPATPSAEDNCDEDVDVFFFQTDLSDPENSTCELSNAEGVNDTENWSIWVPGLPNGVSSNFVWDEDGATAYVSGDEILITGTAVNVDDPSYAFGVYLQGENKEDWSGWNGQNTTSPPILPRSYKDDYGHAAAGGNLWETWNYYEIDGDNSYLFGIGGLAGSQLSVSHAPANYYYGLQIGDAANNKTPGFGLSSWFILDGHIQGEPFTGTGDISSLADCSNPGTQCGYPIFNVWTAVDDCGNVSMCEQTIDVIDDVAPVIECPEDITIECTDSTEPSNTGMATATDNCTDVTITYIDGEVTGSCPASFVRVWAAEDECENRVECEQIIYIDDTISPELEVNADATVECGESFDLVGYTASDNCGLDVTVDIDSAFVADCGLTGVWTITYTASDACENTTVATQTITIVDTTAPSITAADDATVSCDEEFDLAGYEASDICGEVSVDIDSAFVSTCGTAGVWTLTYTATDDCGNTAQDTQIITVVDEEAPVILLPEETVVDISCTDYFCGYQNGLDLLAGELSPEDSAEFVNCTISLFAQYDIIPTGVVDNCDEDLEWTPGLFIPIVHEECTEFEGSTNVKASFICWFNATDECGNAADSVYTVLNIVDFTPPYFDGIPEDTTAECDDIDRSDEVTAYDDCDGEIMFDYQENEFEIQCSGSYILVRTWTATDLCGNSYSQSQQITVVDTTAPEFNNMPEDLTVECDEVPVPVETVTASDNCDNNPTVSMEEIRIDGDCDYNYTLNRVYTASDDCGNTNVYTQVITVEDTTAPEFVGLEPFLEAECDDIPEASDDVATDNCGDVTVTIEDEPFSGGCAGSINRYYTATDECGNSSVYIQIINLIDTTAPTLYGVPDDLTIECDEQAPEFEVTADDNCDEDVPVMMDSEVTPGCSEATYSITYTFTATDECDNSTVATYTLTVVDTTAPELEVNADATVECGESFDLVGYDAEDNCGPVTVDVDSAFVADCGNTGVWTITYTATDECDNSTVATQTITIVDTIAPELYVNEDETVECGESFDLVGYEASDICSEVSVAIDSAFVADCGNTGVWTITYTATDDCDNSTVATQTITIVDTTAPELEANPDATVECGEDFDLVGYTASDVCGDVTVQIDSLFDGSCGNTGVWVIDYTATDECGNTSTDTQVITIVDTTAPEFVGLEPFLNVECDEIPEPVDAMATDACGDVTVTSEDQGFSGGCEGAIQRIYTATDECGNSTTYTQIINVFDATAPELSGVPEDATIECDEAAPEFEVTATDNCDEDVEVVVEAVSTPGCSEATYTVTYTFTATDDCDNSTVDTYTLTVVDTTAPVLEVNADATVECDEEFDLVGYEAIDNCGPVDVDIDSAFVAACGSTGVWTITYTATDACDNSTVATQTITVVDTTAPVVILEDDYEAISCEEFTCGFDVLQAYVAGELTQEEAQAARQCAAGLFVELGLTPVDVLDNCDDDLGWVETDIEAVVYDECQQGVRGYLVCYFQAEDECGNVSEVVSSRIDIIDVTPPVLAGVPDDMMLECDEEAPEVNITATDDCGDVTIEVFEAIIDVFEDCQDGIGSVYTVVATDACGNTATASYSVTYFDTTAPVFGDIPAFISVECDDIPEPMDVEVMDNCSEVTVSVDDDIFSGGCEGAFNRVYTAVDACGNSATFTQIINVFDETAPTLDVNADATVECGESFDLVGYGAADNCSDVSVDIDSAFVAGCGNTGVWTITYTATDDCANSTVDTQIITIVDTTDPTFDNAPENLTADCQQVPAPAEVTASDNCGGASVSMEEEIGTGCPYTITRTYTAVDACGNSAVHTQTITVVDTTAPELSAYPQDEIAECDNIPAAAVLTASDNCDSDVAVSYEETSNGPGCEYTITRTWSATDDCGNSTVHTQTITVVDTTAPEFDDSTVPGDITVECDAIPAPASPTATDNCQDNVTITYGEDEIAGDCDGFKTIIRTWTANDGCGNTSSVSQTINVEDNTAPVVEEPVDETYVCGDEIPGPPVLDISDNCSEMIDVEFMADTVGNTYPYLDCELTTGSAFSGPDWSMFLTIDGTNHYFVLDEDGAQFTEIAVGGGMFEGVITGTVINPDNPSESWEIDVTLINKTDYDGWTSQMTTGNPMVPRQPKAFSGFENPGDELTWDYWEVDATRSQLIGQGAFAGDILALAHAPENYLFGFQVGENANGYAPGFGIGGWFLYSGTINGQSYDGQGDLAFQAECPPCEYTITRTWMVSDDCGNMTTVDQVITVVAPETDGGEGEVEQDVELTAEQYGFVNAYPNPTGAKSILVYKVPVEADVNIEVIAPNGKSMGNIFNGRAYPGIDNYAEFDGTTYDNGLYVVRLMTDNNVFYQKVMLQK